MYVSVLFDKTDVCRFVTPPGHEDAFITWTHCMMHEKKDFASCVSQISYQDSVLDRGVHSIRNFLCEFVSQHVCKMCIPSCAGPIQKALNSHARSKHGGRWA